MDAIPNEMIEEILSNLAVKDLMVVSTVNRMLRYMVHNRKKMLKKVLVKEGYSNDEITFLYEEGKPREARTSINKNILKLLCTRPRRPVEGEQLRLTIWVGDTRIISIVRQKKGTYLL